MWGLNRGDRKKLSLFRRMRLKLAPYGNSFQTKAVPTSLFFSISMSNFNEFEFITRLNSALDRARQILANTTNIDCVANVPHTYESKFDLAEFITNSALTTLLNIFESMELHTAHLAQLKGWSKDNNIMLNFKSEESCQFLRKVSRDIESTDTKSVRGVC